MDGSFAVQALCIEYLAKNRGKLLPGIYDVPKVIDNDVARIALEAQGIVLEKLTEEQVKYRQSWKEGT